VEKDEPLSSLTLVVGGGGASSFFPKVSLPESFQDRIEVRREQRRKGHFRTDVEVHPAGNL
jgi:hypothetical protein